MRGREIGFILQDALVSLDPLRSVGREVAEPIVAHQLLPPAGVPAEVQALLRRAGIADLAVAAQLSQRVAVLQGGRIVEAGPTRQVLTRPQQAYTQRLLAAVPGAATRGRWLATVGEAPARAALPTEQPAVQPPVQPALREVTDVALRFRRPDGSPLHALAGVSLVVRPGETLGVVGSPAPARPRWARWCWRCSNPTAGRFASKGSRGARWRSPRGARYAGECRPSCRIR